MFAGQITSLGRIELVEVEEPELEGSGEIIFEPRCGVLCGSDMQYFREPRPAYPLEPGYSLHELVGTVAATSGTRFRAGDAVLAVPVHQQGLSERFRVSEERAVPLDPRLPLEQAVLAQPLGTVLFALRKIPNVLDLDVAVVGQGPMGQLICAALRNLGARRIFAIDLLEERLEVSLRLGASDVICSTREDPVERLSRLTGDTLADLVIEAVGHRDLALNLCIDLCRPGGRILSFGVPPEAAPRLEWRKLFFRNITVHTSVNPEFSRDFPLAMRWIAEGRIDVSGLVTHRFPLGELQTAYDTFSERRDRAMKVLVEFPAAGGRPGG